jgi:beta-glucanase (GH16 family)
MPGHTVAPMRCIDSWVVRVAGVAAILAVSGCGTDFPPPLSQVEARVPEVADNEGVAPGGPATLVFAEEFEGDSLSPDIWFSETGDGSQYGIPGWGNNEQQWYLPENAVVSDGVLKVTAKRQVVNGFQYTSARINTRDRFAFRYGRIEARIKLPAGQGLWPAFWLLAQDSPYGEWAASGEIDIMEAVNLDGTGGNEILGTIHFGGESPDNQFTSVYYTPATDITDDYHVYAVEWDRTELRWYIDDVLYAVQNSWFSTAAPFPAPFDQPFYILLNVAVGGNLPGEPDPALALPATMEVDWVRVYSGE